MVRSRHLTKSCGCGKNFPGKSRLVSKDKVRYWILQLASELSDRLKIEEEKVRRSRKQSLGDSTRNVVVRFPFSSNHGECCSIVVL